ncbi:MAG: MBL fold metallo-hydrolase [Acidimicrobiia bacterium]|nr:MBL fold metallo-hydrolase [Acidimicrobiia bacterium]
MTASRPREIGDGIWMIDAHMFGVAENLSSYVIPEPVPTLVEPGPATCREHILSGLAALGVETLARIVTTHVHLDHAGGTGELARRFPEATVHVHRIGAPHLLDPSRLVRSATRIYGEDGMRDLWGPITPVEPDRLHAVDEGEFIRIGPHRRLEVLYTPGHAKHHMSLFDSTTGIMFAGDSVGLTFPGSGIVQPVVPPPDIDVELLVSQFARYRDRDTTALAFAHFGVEHDVGRLLDEAERRLRLWTDVVLRHRDATPAEVGDRIREANHADLQARGRSAREIARVDERTTYATEASGLLRYVHSQAPTSPGSI